MQKTYSPKQGEVERAWHVVDADGVAVGRLSTIVARLLTGKNKPSYAPHIDTGDFVIVINADKAVFTGAKETTKVYYRHSTHPGGLKAETPRELRQRLPHRIIEKAVRGMLPKNKIGRRQLRKLKVYAGPNHPHEAQQPSTFALTA